MRKKLTVYGFLVIGFVALIVWFYCGPLPGIGAGLSARDVIGIRRSIRQETSEPIQKIHGEGSGAATVRTGRVGNGLDGKGHFYYLNKGAKGWQIVRRETWLSFSPNKSHPAYPPIAMLFHDGDQWRGAADAARYAVKLGSQYAM